MIDDVQSLFPFYTIHTKRHLHRFGPYYNFEAIDCSIYCHITLTSMNYLLYTFLYISSYIEYRAVNKS